MGRTRPEKLWLGGAAFGALLIAVTGYFFLISPQRATTSATRDEVGSAQLQESALQSRIISLTAQNAKLDAYRAALSAAQTALPDASDTNATPNLLRSLASLASATSTSLGSVTVGDPTTATPAPAAPATGTTSTPTTATTPPANPISTLDVQTTVSGSIGHLSAFLSKLQSGSGRAVLVTNVTLAQKADVGSGSGTTLTLDMIAFVRST